MVIATSSQENARDTSFQVNGLNHIGVTLSYERFIGEYVNSGASISYYQGRDTIEDRNFQLPGGGPVRRSITLRINPVEANFRVLPIGRDVPVILFVGGGIGVYLWKYGESGDFVIDRSSSSSIANGTVNFDAANFGFHGDGGIQIPLSESLALTSEVKYWKVEADLTADQFNRSFEPIDLH